jgi:glucose/mannose transport system substrate-binding protein
MEPLLMRRISARVLAALSLLLAAPAWAAEVEVLHWWTAGGEASALNVLKQNLERQGVRWRDMPIAGGGGSQAMTVLRARVTARNPPTAAQMLGFDIRDWATLGALADLNALAEREHWQDVIPAAIREFSQYEGRWIAVPVNVHSVNWVWANKALLDRLGIAVPRTWEAFVAALDQVKAAGRIPLAHGGQPWQEATIFDSVAMLTGGPEFYRSALIKLDPQALRSATMRTVFERMAVLRRYVDGNFSGRDWNLATALVVKGDAAFQIMGDWAKGEFLNAGKQPNVDFLCFRFPGTQDTVIFNSDQFAMFNVAGEARGAQEQLARAIMDPAFQIAFNRVKGSVPARLDVPADGFDACGQQGIQDLARAAQAGRLIGSLSQGHGAPAAVKNAFYDVITAHFNGEYDTDEAIEELVSAVAAAR